MPKGTRLVSIFILIGIFTSFFSANISAKEDFIPAFSFNHPDCNVKVLLKEDALFLKDTVQEMCRRRRLNMSVMKNPKDIYKGEMYLKVDFIRIDKKLYDHCQVDVKLLLAKEDRYTSSRDTILYDQKSTRSLPRITLKGNERCHRALKDAFIHIPTCIKR